MGTSRTWAPFTLLAFALTPIVAFGLPGDANAVIQHCGAPTAEHQGMSAVTNQLERDLYYGKMILHFDAASEGWNFRSAWSGRLPLSQSGVEERMPCFAAAMKQVASAPQTTLDPTTGAQVSHAPQLAGLNFGIPMLWLIFLLAGVLLVFVAIPRRQRRLSVRGLAMEDRPFRRPRVPREMIRLRRRTDLPRD